MIEYQTCDRCVMDTTDKEIFFNEKGVCNHCIDAEKKIRNYIFSTEQETKNVEFIANTIKKESRGQYDSILGLSGGVDSSYVAYLAHKMGLNPLCVHFDNGWNSDIAVTNINNIIENTGFDLFTYVINWPEFRDLQRSFIKAGVIDIEMLSDQAIFATMFKLRSKYGIKSVLSGTNYSTEHGMPRTWSWNKMDLRNIKGIQKRFGSKKLKEFPTMNSIQWRLMLRFGLGGRFVELLNSVTYKKYEAMETLKNTFDWKYYGGKHYESVFTKFYQAYILPVKFNVDKRKVHFSCLIRNGELTRDKVLEELEKPLYEESDLRNDREFVLKKLGFSEQEFLDIMSQAPHEHHEYPTDRVYVKPLIQMGKLLFGKRILS
jgi:N-acetyl sugar amidotransferase